MKTKYEMALQGVSSKERKTRLALVVVVRVCAMGAAWCVWTLLGQQPFVIRFSLTIGVAWLVSTAESFEFGALFRWHWLAHLAFYDLMVWGVSRFVEPDVVP